MRPVAVALFLVAACRREAPRADPSRIDVPVASRSAAPAVGASAVPDAATSEAAAARSRTREGAPGSTRGTVSCGAARCASDAEACVHAADGTWSCVTVASSPPRGEHFRCDDASDCTTEGMTCCEPEKGYRYCGDRAAVDSDPCGLEVCNGDQDAPACPAGQSCVDGTCRPPDQRATCGGKRCPPEAPYCSWEGGKGTCVGKDAASALRAAHEKGDPAASIFQCTRRSDCGTGHVCCSDTLGASVTGGVLVTECRYGCKLPLYEDVCEKSADCPTFFATGANGGAVKQKCSKLPASAAHPSGLGKCSP